MLLVKKTLTLLYVVVAANDGIHETSTKVYDHTDTGNILVYKDICK